MIKKKCSNAMCSQMIPRSKQPPYCSEHDPTASNDKHYDMYDRDPKSKAFYSSQRWVKFRWSVLCQFHHLCQLQHQGCNVTADTVHHIVEVKEDWDRRFERDNCLPTCRSCHAVEHGIK